MVWFSNESSEPATNIVYVASLEDNIVKNKFRCYLFASCS